MRKRWSYNDAISQANDYVANLNIPKIKFQLDKPEADLNFADVMNASAKELSDYLVMYGGIKGLLEQHVADLEARKGAMQAQFDEAYNISLFQVTEKYRIENERKPSKEQLRGEILMANPALMDLLRDSIDVTTIYNKTLGELRLYTSAYATVSRVVALRTKSYEESIYGRDA
jgi:hypothetical protein